MISVILLGVWRRGARDAPFVRNVTWLSEDFNNHIGQYQCDQKYGGSPGQDSWFAFIVPPTVLTYI
jgi:hypothetical protein